MRLLSLFTTAISLASAGYAASNSTTFATFVYSSPNSPTLNNSLVWSINAVQATGDIYFHLEAPWSGSWIAVGFGNSMPGALMVVAYPASNGVNMTVAPRIATGYAEPSYTQDKKIELIWDRSGANAVNQDSAIMSVSGVCHNCTTWNGGSLDLKSTTAPFIFAAGPMGYLQSDSPEAPMKRHAFYGGFTMDLTAATSQANGSVPNPSNGVYTVSHATAQPTFQSGDNNGKEMAHAGLMILSWLIIFPIGSLFLRLFNKVILHAIVQVIGMGLIAVSFGLGISISKYYNRSKNFNSAHQVIGILLFAGLLAQLGLGIVGHRIFKRTNQPAKMMKIHVGLGAVLVFAAAVNGGLGLSLAQNGFIWLHYLILCIAIFIVFTGIRLCAHRCMRRRNERRQHQQQGIVNHGVGPDGYQFPQYAMPKEPHVQSVPLRPYAQSSESMPHYAGSEQQPRPMV